MSSTPASVLRSTVFARVLRASTLFILAALAVLWALTALLLAQIASAEWAEIEGEAAFIESVISEDGLDGFLALAAEEDLPRFWPEEYLYERLEEEQFIFSLRRDEDLIAGYAGLWPTQEPERVPLDHPEIDASVRSVTLELPEMLLTVARFIPEREDNIARFAQIGSISLFLIGLPLSLSIGYFLSREVYRRIEAISETAAAVAAGDMARRAPVTGQNDEFDRLAQCINRMLGALAQLNENIEAVSVGVAHDLKTPLANIGGRLELMERDASDGAALEGHIQAARGYLDELLRIFDALLRLGEVEAGGRKAAFAPVDLSRLVRDMCAT